MNLQIGGKMLPTNAWPDTPHWAGDELCFYLQQRRIVGCRDDQSQQSSSVVGLSLSSTLVSQLDWQRHHCWVDIAGGRRAGGIRAILGLLTGLPRDIGIPNTKPPTKFEVSSSSSFGDMFDRIPKNCRVMWPRPCPISGKIICAPARHSPYKSAHQIWSL